MFTSLKNKIREETGNEVPPHFIQRNSQGSRGLRGSVDSVHADTVIAECRDEIAKLQGDLVRERDEWGVERESLLDEKQLLEEKLLAAQEHRRRLSNVHDERDLLESLQAQELAKVKHLLLSREQELADKSQTLQETILKVTHLQAELSRLRRTEGQLTIVQEQFTIDTSELNLKLHETQEKIHSLQTALDKERHEKDEALLRNAQISQTNEICRQELRAQENELTDAQSLLLKSHNNLKNVEIELKKLQDNSEPFETRFKDLELKLVEKQNRIDSLESDCKVKCAENDETMIKYHLLMKRVEELKSETSTNETLQEQINEKNKTIKVLNQRLNDLKKTLQHELKQGVDFSNSREQSINQTYTDHTASNNKPALDEVNFKYLRHVIVKFLTSREVEARHLIRAVATVLHLSAEEEKLLQDTLDWRMSWFGARPDIGSGQSARAIPPS